MNFQDPELEESIMTLGSFDLYSSSIGLFSDADDDDEETFIEIALERAPTVAAVVPQLDDREAGGDIHQKTSSTIADDIHHDEEIEFRISFSSSVNVSFPGLISSSSPTSPTNTTTISNSSKCSSSTTSADDDHIHGYAIKAPAAGSLPPPPPGGGGGGGGGPPPKLSPIYRTSNKKRRDVDLVQFPVLLFDPLFKVFQSAPKQQSSWQISEENGPPEGETRQTAINSGSSRRELERSSSLPRHESRKTSKVTTAMNGGVMKFFMKFQSISIRSMLTSFLKFQKVISPTGGGGHSQPNKRGSKVNLKKYRRRLMKPFDRWSIQRNLQQGEISTNSNIDHDNCFGNGNGNGRERSRVLEFNLNSIRGMLESLSMNSTTGRKVKQTKSCPSSIKTSPIHGGGGGGGVVVVVGSESRSIYTRENSVQAAIAHCKRSFGQTAHFH